MWSTCTLSFQFFAIKSHFRGYGSAHGAGRAEAKRAADEAHNKAAAPQDGESLSLNTVGDKPRLSCHLYATCVQSSTGSEKGRIGSLIGWQPSCTRTPEPEHLTFPDDDTLMLTDMFVSAYCMFVDSGPAPSGLEMPLASKLGRQIFLISSRAAGVAWPAVHPRASRLHSQNHQAQVRT